MTSEVMTLQWNQNEYIIITIIIITDSPIHSDYQICM